MNLFRKTIFLLVGLSVFSAAASFFSQYILGMNPCVLCIEQRLCVLAAGLLALASAFSRQNTHRTRIFSALLISLPAGYGIYVASYQIWLQSLPPTVAPACGAPWTFRLKDWPLFDWFEPIVRGFGNCAQPDYLLGIPFPVWSISYFSLVILLLCAALYATRRHPSS